MTTDATPDLRVGDPVWLYGVWPTDRVHGWHLASIVRVSGPCWVVERADGSGLAVPRWGSTGLTRTIALGGQPLRAYLTREAALAGYCSTLAVPLVAALAEGCTPGAGRPVIQEATLREVGRVLGIELPTAPFPLP